MNVWCGPGPVGSDTALQWAARDRSMTCSSRLPQLQPPGLSILQLGKREGTASWTNDGDARGGSSSDWGRLSSLSAG